MSRLESANRLVRRWFIAIPLLALVGLIVGTLVSTMVIPKPNIGTITISGAILQQSYTDDILDMLRYARGENNIKAVVLQIDSPGGAVSVVEQIYLDVLRLRQHKPVVASVGARAASGGYHIAVAANLIYAEPSSMIGSIGVIGILPSPEELDEEAITSGPFKAIGGSRRNFISRLETIRQQFVTAVVSQRGEHLKLSEEEISWAAIYSGVESLEHGLIDNIGTSTVAIEEAASLAGIRNYGVVNINKKLGKWQPTYWPFFTMEDLKSLSGPMPGYYYLYFELR